MTLGRFLAGDIDLHGSLRACLCVCDIPIYLRQYEQNVLATSLSVDRNTASVVVEQLVKLGLAARQINGADRRSRLLNLSAKGKRLYARLLPVVSSVNAEVLAPLSPRERKQFMGLLLRVIEGNLVHQKSPPRRRRRKLSHAPGDNA